MSDIKLIQGNPKNLLGKVIVYTQLPSRNPDGEQGQFPWEGEIIEDIYARYGGTDPVDVLRRTGAGEEIIEEYLRSDYAKRDASLQDPHFSLPIFFPSEVDLKISTEDIIFAGRWECFYKAHEVIIGNLNSYFNKFYGQKNLIPTLMEGECGDKLQTVNNTYLDMLAPKIPGYVKRQFVMPMMAAQRSGDINEFNRKKQGLENFFSDAGVHSEFSDAAKNLTATIAWFGGEGVDNRVIHKYLKIIQLIADEKYDKVSDVQEMINGRMHRFAYLRNNRHNRECDGHNRKV